MADTESKETESNQDPNNRQHPPSEANAAEAPTAPAPVKKKKPILPIIGGILLIAALFFGTRFYLYNKIHVSTDDAYVTGDLVNVSPQINGTLQTLTVQEGDFVTKGQLIATLDPSAALATLRQAQANYDAAESQIPVAQQNLQFEKLSTDAAVHKAQSALGAQQSKTNGARQQVTLTSDTVRNQISQAQASVSAANAQWQQAKAQVASAVASKDNYVQAVQTSRDALANYQQQILTAQHAQQAASARADAAAALADKAKKDAARYQILYSEDAISAQNNDQAQSTARNADSQLDAARSDVQQAASQVESARRAATQAQSQVEQSKKNVAQANAQVAAAQKAADAAQQQEKVAQAGLGVAEANTHQVGVQESNLDTTSQQTGEAEADVATAQSGQAQVASREQSVKTAEAQAEQAKAALTNAQITVANTKIFAPSSGEVVRKDSNVGSTMSPGSTVVTLTKGDYVWIIANFKETQLQDVRVGQPAEIEVDAFPGKIFKGRVRNITEATGAATALLPPDNATGNFTKVVQRIPVRIELVPAKPGEAKQFATARELKNLRQGMSVTATINTSNKGRQSSVSSASAEDSTRPTGGVGTPPDATGQSSPNTGVSPGLDNGTSGSQIGSQQSDALAAQAGTTSTPPAVQTRGPRQNLPNSGGTAAVPNPGTPPVSSPNSGLSSPANPAAGVSPSAPNTPASSIGTASGGTSSAGSSPSGTPPGGSSGSAGGGGH